MACLITQGRLLPCKEFIGGLYKVWFINYGTAYFQLDADNVVSGITAAVNGVSITGATTIYEYELKGTSKLDQDMVSSRENGTTYVTQTLTLDLAGADYNMNNQVKLLAYGRPIVIVQDNYGSAWVAGRLRGLDVTSALNSTGGAISEKYGYTITMVGIENEYANFVKGSVISDAFVGLVGTKPTIVKGS